MESITTSISRARGKKAKKGAIEDAAAIEARAVTYARWLADRDKIELPVGSIASPVWSDFKNGTKAKRISAVSFGGIVVDIPHWDLNRSA
jgi:hypothetical protein